MGKRSELHQEAVDALLESNAIDFRALGEVFANQGGSLAKRGVEFSVVINWRAIDVCIPPDPYRVGTVVREIGASSAGAESQG